MRWTLIVVLCVAVASAKYASKNRIARMLQDIADFGKELGREFDDDDDSMRSSDESTELMDDESDEDDVWREPRHHHSPRTDRKEHQRKHCKNCDGTTKKSNKRDPRIEDEDFESDGQFVDDSDNYGQHRRPSKRTEKDGPCQPKKSLIPKLGQLNTHLAARLYQEAKQVDDDKNILVSPVSVQLSLAALAQGARGNTKRQLNQLLDMSMATNQNRNAYAALARALKGEGDQSESKSAKIKCSTNLVLGQQSAREQFIESIKTCFDGEVKKCNFRQKPQQCREQIEQWMAEKIGQPKLPSNAAIGRTTVTGNTKMVSIGSTQIKTNWGKQFRKGLKIAQGRFFALGEQRATDVKVMQTEGLFNYYEDEQMQVLGVQTQEKQLTVYVLLPKERHGLNRMDKHRIQFGKQLEQILSQCDSNKRTVAVQLPQFQIVHKSEEAKRVLRKLGVEDAFDMDQADFSAISEPTAREHSLKYGHRRQTGGLEDIDVEMAKKEYQQGQLHLNKMIQVATLQVDENGLDSASAHHVHVGKAKLHRETDSDDDDNDNDDDRSDSDDNDHESGRGQFKVDHGFAFIVKHNPTKQMLLIGRVVDVTQKPVNEHVGNRDEETD